MHFLPAEPKAQDEEVNSNFLLVELYPELDYVQTGYNLLYSVWKYGFDADCSLFLKILKGDIKEDVYLQQINLQVESFHKVFIAKSN